MPPTAYAAALWLRPAPPKFKHIAYGDPAAPYLGMSKTDIIACAGPPHSRYQSGGATETLTYHYEGAGPVPGEAAQSRREGTNPRRRRRRGASFAAAIKKDNKDWTCTASLVFENDHLTRVNFAHKDVEALMPRRQEKDRRRRRRARRALPTCTFSLPAALRKA